MLKVVTTAKRKKGITGTLWACFKERKHSRICSAFDAGLIGKKGCCSYKQFALITDSG
jgi:hypothetical protein